MKSTSKPIMTSAATDNKRKEWIHSLSGVEGVIFITHNTPLDDPFVALEQEIQCSIGRPLAEKVIKGIKK